MQEFGPAAGRAALFVSTFWGSSRVFPVGAAYGQEVHFRPPSSVFGLAWGLLSAAAGASWGVAHVDESLNSPPPLLVDSGFVSLLACLIAFSAFSRDRKKAASWSVAGASAVALTLTASMNSWQAKALLSPLCAWLNFALIMQTTLVQSGSA